MNCIELYITKSIRSVITDKYTAKCRYMYMYCFFFLFLQMSMNATAPPPIPATLLLRNARTQKGAFCVIVKMATGKSARRVKVNFKNQWTP